MPLKNSWLSLACLLLRACTLSSRTVSLCVLPTPSQRITVVSHFRQCFQTTSIAVNAAVLPWGGIRVKHRNKMPEAQQAILAKGKDSLGGGGWGQVGYKSKELKELGKLRWKRNGNK